MEDLNYKNKRKDILSYLRGNYNPEGKKLLNLWFIKKEKGFPAFDNYSKDELSNISIRMKSGIEAKITKKETESKSIRLNATRTKKQQSGRWIYMAASIALFTILGTFLYQHSHKRMENLSGDNLTLYQVRHVPHGQKLKLELTDGSVIFLNSGSEFRFPERFNSGSREVYLKGEAYFEIAEMSEKPFIVHTSGLKTTVLGTSFNIKAFDEEPGIFVTVSSGEVQVEVDGLTLERKEETVYLSADEQAIFSKASGDISTRKVSALEFLSWKENILRFDNLSLAEITVILERWFNVEIRFENEGLKSCYFMGRHENPKLYNILESISYSTGMQWEMEDRKIWLKGKGCSPR